MFFSRNNEVQFAGEIQPRGCHYSLKFSPGRKVVLSELNCLFISIVVYVVVLNAFILSEVLGNLTLNCLFFRGRHFRGISFTLSVYFFPFII